MQVQWTMFHPENAQNNEEHWGEVDHINTAIIMAANECKHRGDVSFISIATDEVGKVTRFVDGEYKEFNISLVYDVNEDGVLWTNTVRGTDHRLINSMIFNEVVGRNIVPKNITTRITK